MGGDPIAVPWAPSGGTAKANKRLHTTAYIDLRMKQAFADRRTENPINRPPNLWYKNEVLGRVLFVDDEAVVIDALSRAVLGEPLEVHAASNAATALELLGQMPFDVIISDDDMPGMTGTELLEVVHRQYPDVVRIIYTGYATLQRAVRAINEGHIFQYLLKPCKPTEIVSVVREALKEKRERDATALTMNAARKQHRVLRELTKEVDQLAPLFDAGLEPGTASTASDLRAPGHPRHAEIGFGTLDPGKLSLLTPREREFLRALASGKHVKDSAVELNISVHTARNHMKALLRKLGVRSQIELLAKLFGRDR
jgi:DNA-binding NarL/FixJ family response regulator